MNDEPRRKKIAILGGGVGAMTAAFAITEKPGWQDEYEITVYQLGWRLGGKGATGRNVHNALRIEEHGLHVWSGFYNNAFRVMRTCYQELGRAPGTPLATLDDAFKPLDVVTFTEYIHDQWRDWTVEFPRCPGDVGTGDTYPTPWQYVRIIIGWMHRFFANSKLAPSTEPAHWGLLPDWVHDIVAAARDLAAVEIDRLLLGDSAGPCEAEAPGVTVPPPAGAHPLRHAAVVVAAAPEDPSLHPESLHDALRHLIESFRDRLRARIDGLLDTDDEARHIWLGIDLGTALVRGILSDGVLQSGFDVLDDREWTDWLKGHGLSDVTAESPALTDLYDYVFAFGDGDPAKRAGAAGVMTRCLLRLTTTYRTAIFMEMQAGMGETVFSPMYMVLKKRGVNFEFFHRVKNLGLSADRHAIDTIRMGRQVNVKEGAYQPFLPPVCGFEGCWPSEPLYDQIVEGEELKSRGINLESAWSGWNDVDERTLQLGQDFDEVVLGISIAALRDCCPELIAADPRWQAMVDGVKATRTLAIQLWFTPDATTLGRGRRSILTSYAQPFDTFSDMSYLIPREAWPASNIPKTASYFCGPLLMEPPAPYSDTDYPARVTAGVRSAAVTWLTEYLGHVYPQAVGPDGVRWDLLTSLQGGEGEARFDSQYVRANVNPTDLYVQSVPGSTTLRLRAGDSGFANLYLAGDWVRNGLNYGCVESAVMGGLQAARALCGCPQTIIGETDWPES